jgi:hypothetical protein
MTSKEQRACDVAAMCICELPRGEREVFLASIIDRYVDDLLREYSHLGADEIARNALAFRAAIKQRVAEIEASGGSTGGTA